MRRLGGMVFAIALVACTEEVRLGQRCDYSSECQAPLRCGFGRCRPECRVNVDCALGAVCRLDPEGIGSCTLEDDPGCDGPSECAAGLACVNRSCVDACESDADCVGGNECWALPSLEISFCVDSRARPDAGMPVEGDGGMPDAGPPPPDAWIEGDAGRACPSTGCGEVVDVEVAYRHVCALTRGGAVWCWGSDESGESSARLDGREDCGGVPCRTAPVRVEISGSSPIVALAAGAGFTCGRRDDGKIVCWGGDASGALGREAEGPAALEVEGVAGATSLAAGSGFAIATEATRLAGWGDNRNGQLQGASDPSAPVAVGIGPATISVGGHHVCALRGSVVRCWGANQFGQLGRALPGSEEWTPDEGTVEGLASSAARLVAGASRTCVLDGDGAIVCWGYDVEGASSPPALVPHGEPVDLLWSAPSSLVFCGVTRSGAPVCFGRAENDALWADGTGNVRVRPASMHPSLPRPVIEITTDGATGCHVGGSGELWCWGDDTFGQLGRGSSGGTDRAPARVIIPAD